ERAGDPIARVVLRDLEPEGLEVTDREGRRGSREDAWQLRPEGHRPEGRALMLAVVLAVAIEPAVGCDLHARRARLHVVLGVEMAAGGGGGADGVNGREALVVPPRLEGGEGRVQPEVAVQIDDVR